MYMNYSYAREQDGIELRLRSKFAVYVARILCFVTATGLSVSRFCGGEAGLSALLDRFPTPTAPYNIHVARDGPCGLPAP